MNEELALLRSTLDEAMAANFPPDWIPSAAGELAEAPWRQATELSWDQLALPEELGGFGASVRPLVALAQASGRHRLPLPLVETALARDALAAAAVEQPPDGAVITVGPVAAVQISGEATLSGRVSRLPWARRASHAVLALADGLALLDVGASGVEVTHGKNLAGEPRDELELSSARAAAWEARPDVSQRLAERASLVRSAQILGGLAACLALTREHVVSRKQFGRPLISFQLVGAHIAELAARVALVGALLDDAVCAHDAGRGAMARAALEVVASEAATVGARSAHQCHGAIGVTREHRLGQYTTRLWSWREEWGNEFTAASELGRAASDPWSLSAPMDGAARETTNRPVGLS